MTAVRFPLTRQLVLSDVALAVPPVTSADAIARHAVRLLARADQLEAGSVLLFEPRSEALARGLRMAGFGGEIHAISQSRQIVSLSAEWVDQAAQVDWVSASTLSTEEEEAATSVPELSNAYSMVLVDGLERLVAEPAISHTLLWLGSQTAKRGYLGVVQEAGAGRAAVIAELARSGFILARDADYIADTWSWELSFYQRWTPSQLRQAEDIRRVSLDEMLNSPVLSALVESYQDAFSGDDWQEWVRCVDPTCGRQYSRRQVNGLPTPDYCVCGYSQPLVLFHPESSIVEKLRREIPDAQSSCCYLALDTVAQVDGFSWGYLSPVSPLVSELAQGLSLRASATLSAALQSLIAEYALHSGEPLVYYHSEIGVSRRSRGSSLFRWLCLRTLETIDDQGAEVLCLRTSKLSSLYPMLLGIGLRQIFAYDEWSAPEYSHTVAANDQELAVADRRVILAGGVREVLRVFSQEPDFKLLIRNSLKRSRHGG